MKYVISPAGLKDLNALKKLEKLVFKEDAWPVIDLLAVLLLPGYIHLKAQVGNAIVGFISVEENIFEKTAWITTVGVDPAYRRQGIGRAMVLAVEKLYRRPLISLCVRVSNLGAIQLYENLGYRKKRTRRKYYADGEDAFEMKKEREIISPLLPQPLQ
ncbi:MAG TPA: N-acetyltransferase [Leptolinea sp.]